MELFDKFLGDLKLGMDNPEKEKEHAVIVSFNYGIEELDPLHDLEDELISVITDRNVGTYDGHEIAMDSSDGTLFMYGPNAEELFKAVKQILDRTDFLKGAIATLRFGGPGTDAPEIEVPIGE